ncbi:uncharacterized protein RSE6_00577 [Rhynchosporium secalis]|uniref:Uncharacterized protein n=1 Tax=Rhynchosporium secalis TaxID=38038 RepID=A0A1E1LVL1_RHYSE|nr:uncharacterized protein RSE6_00577 [Rhynchosporium secalis]
MISLRSLVAVFTIALPVLAADTLVRSACTCIGPNTTAYRYAIDYYNGRLEKSWKAVSLCSGPPDHCSLDPTSIGRFCSSDKRFCYRFRNSGGDIYSLDGKDVRTPSHKHAVAVSSGCEEFCGGLKEEARQHQVLAQGFFIRPAYF